MMWQKFLADLLFSSLMAGGKAVVNRFKTDAGQRVSDLTVTADGLAAMIEKDEKAVIPILEAARNSVGSQVVGRILSETLGRFSDADDFKVLYETYEEIRDEIEKTLAKTTGDRDSDTVLTVDLDDVQKVEAMKDIAYPLVESLMSECGNDIRRARKLFIAVHSLEEHVFDMYESDQRRTKPRLF